MSSRFKEGLKAAFCGKCIRLFLVAVFFTNVLACATAYDKRGVYHVVRGGESIGKIAKYYHVPVQDLAEWNNIQDANEIKTGLKLYIPRHGKKGAKKGKRVSPSERAKYSESIRFERGKFIWPVNGKVLSNFGIRNGRRHDGMDIKATRGAPIEAAAKGRVAFSGALKGYGNMIIISHKDRFFTVYAHNSKNSVKKGQEVAKGKIIGYVGATGRATGPHLHFEIREGQKARNPLFFLPAEAAKTEMIAKVEKKKKKTKSARKKDKSEEIQSAKGTTEGEVNVKDLKPGYSGRKKMMEDLKVKRSNR